MNRAGPGFSGLSGVVSLPTSLELLIKQIIGLALALAEDPDKTSTKKMTIT